MQDVDVVSSSLDQPLRRISAQEVIDRVDWYINKCADGNDLPSALEYIQKWDTTIKLSGVSLARTFYMMLMRWDRLSGKSFNHWWERQDDFEQVMFDKVGKAKDTVRRYVMVGSLLESLKSRVGRLGESNQKIVMEELPGRHMGDLIAVAQHEKEHGALSPTQLLGISMASDSTEVRRLLREYRGLEEAASPMLYTLDPDGTVWARQGGESVIIGFLRITESDLQNPLRAKAIERLKKRSGFME